MSIEAKIKKPRAAAQVWKKFYLVGRTDAFFIGKTKLIKAGYFTATIASTGDTRYVNPLRRVRTEERLHKPTAKPFVPLASPEYPNWETAGGTTPEQNDAHFNRGPVSQPNSDNGISGPTS